MAVYFLKAVVSVLGLQPPDGPLGSSAACAQSRVRLYVYQLRCAAARRARHKALEGILSILFLAAKEKKDSPFLPGRRLKHPAGANLPSYQIGKIPFSGRPGGHKIGAAALQGLCAPRALRPELRQSRAWRGPWPLMT
jgi:hypothetical protein